ncbi:MAG: isoleucine--tRNA ligase [Alphaproteobacteria bacterium]|nr:isoleucine--tRNA ligase [Alphaproteobacteria bacterium]
MAKATAPTSAETERRDYKQTLFLPETSFPMKAGLPAAEPKWLERWAALDLYGTLRKTRKDAPRFVYHDGPPYANGNIHIGTALNKILKDFVVRTQTMLGKDALFVPGWDCHGLPIEWKIEEKYRAAGKNKDDVPLIEFRQECRDFAAHWIDVQREEFKRLGIIADWDEPYLTMNKPAEAQIVREVMKFLMNGLLYRGSKPVMWSVVEKTALAEAEVEYHEKLSPTIFVKFKVTKGAQGGAFAVIWTTTPWTIPGNRAIAYSPDIAYGLYEVKAAEEGAFARPGERLILADTLAAGVLRAAKAEATRLSDIDPKGLVCAHPFRGQGYEFDVPLLPGDHVTAETGTGLVHTAPGHGEEDFELGRKFDLEVPFTVGEDGVYLDSVPLFAGKRVLKDDGTDGDANGAVIGALIEAGALLAKGKLRHDYPHSWRSKAPIIFRNTPQWFIAMDRPIANEGGRTLRELALAAIDATAFYPASGRNRLRSMVEKRPDWVLSRQRAWGVPITVFVRKADGEVLRDEAVNARIADAVEKDGSDAWFTADPQALLGSAYKATDFDRVTDIVDVWFESGCTHAFVLEKRADHSSPADVYLEGSDQHRGWFQSSLLESCATRGRAPFKALVTHGFILDEKGQEKMAKSKGNTLSPNDVAKQHGAEILRLWVASSDYMNDIRFGPGILQSVVDSYRKLRNTIRFLLANLAGFSQDERLAPDEMPELDRLILHRLCEMDALVRDGYAAYDFDRVLSALMSFASSDLSSFYFDIRKDALYCDGRASVRRRAVRTVMDEIFARLTTWLAPVLCFTMEEAFAARFGDDGGSIHVRAAPETPEAWRDPALALRWERVRELRRVVTGALELARREKTIGASLEAAPTLVVADEADAALLARLDLDEIWITSGATVAVGSPPEGAFALDDVAGAAVVFAEAKGTKCERCWQVLEEVGSHADHPGLCNRCHETVTHGA